MRESHACLCGILSDAMEGGFLAQNPAWRTYKYTGKKKRKRNIADEGDNAEIDCRLGGGEHQI